MRQAILEIGSPVKGFSSKKRWYIFERGSKHTYESLVIAFCSTIGFMEIGGDSLVLDSIGFEISFQLLDNILTTLVSSERARISFSRCLNLFTECFDEACSITLFIEEVDFSIPSCIFKKG